VTYIIHVRTSIATTLALEKPRIKC